MEQLDYKTRIYPYKYLSKEHFDKLVKIYGDMSIVEILFKH